MNELIRLLLTQAREALRRMTELDAELREISQMRRERTSAYNALAEKRRACLHLLRCVRNDLPAGEPKEALAGLIKQAEAEPEGDAPQEPPWDPDDVVDIPGPLWRKTRGSG